MEHSHIQKLISLAEKHHIAYRQPSNRLVLVYADNFDEHHIFFEDMDEYFKPDAVIKQFLTMQSKRQKVINAFKQRILERKASYALCSDGLRIETKDGVGTGPNLHYQLTQEIDVLRVEETLYPLCILNSPL